eukprot:scaffold199090_cov22-Tisochrysis_lutea.AAC.2
MPLRKAPTAPPPPLTACPDNQPTAAAATLSVSGPLLLRARAEWSLPWSPPTEKPRCAAERR